MVAQQEVLRAGGVSFRLHNGRYEETQGTAFYFSRSEKEDAQIRECLKMTPVVLMGESVVDIQR